MTNHPTGHHQTNPIQRLHIPVQIQFNSGALAMKSTKTKTKSHGPVGLDPGRQDQGS